MTHNSQTSAGLMTQRAADAVTTIESQIFQVKPALIIIHNVILLTPKVLRQTCTCHHMAHVHVMEAGNF